VITLLLKTTLDERQVRGGVLHGNSLRLLGVDAIDIEVPLGGNLIYMRNRDVPGVVGKIGTLLGRHNVNIGNFALGRKDDQDGAEAIAVVQVDSPAPEAVLQEIRQLPEINEVCGIKI
jgi:D-3-phosphoglycerate dehydrogenase